MLINVYGHGFSVTGGLLEQTQRQIESGFSWASPSLRDVDVHLCDINGDHGGDDKSCMIQVRLRHGQPVVARSIHRDMYAAIAAATAKAKKAVVRALGRRHSGRRAASVRHVFNASPA